MAISPHTRKVLWSFSGNACARCGTQLVQAPAAGGDPHAIVGRECHIVAKAPLGPRGTSGSRVDLDSYDNSILLCANCHAVVDGQTEQFPPEELRRLKHAHEQRVRGAAAPSVLDISLTGRDKPMRLEPVLSGDALLRLLASAFSCAHDYPERMSETQREMVGDFLQSCHDLSEAYDEVGPKDRLDAGQDLQAQIESLLVEEGLAVLAGTRKLTLAGNGNKCLWPEAVVKVVNQKADIEAAAVNVSA